MINKYKIRVVGKNTNHFFNELIKRKINIYEINKKKKNLIIVIDVEQYDDILSIETSCKIEIIDRIGISKYKYLLIKNYIFVLFFCLAILFSIFLSNIIFDVEVVHSNNKLKEVVYKDLEYYGIEKYRFKISYNEREKIKKKILKKEIDNLEWMEIEEIGTKYVINIEERKKNKNIKLCKNRNIVAKKDAMILEIKADSGEIVKKINDYVKKGDVLISGVIHNKEDVVSNKCAIGKVYGEVWYKINIILPIYYEEKRKTGNNSYGLELRVLNSSVDFFENYDDVYKNRVISFNTGILPIDINFVKYDEVNIIEKKYDIINVDKDALIIAEERLKKYFNDKEKVITKKVLKKEMKESKIYIEVFVKVKEDITSYEKIKEKEVEE